VVIRPASLVLLLLLAGPARAATVLSVGDGDTLRVVDGGKRLTIRMACIDAPETAQRSYGAAIPAATAGAGPGRFGGVAPLPDHRQVRPHRGRGVPQWPKHQPGDGEQRPGLRLSEVSERLRWLRLPRG